MDWRERDREREKERERERGRVREREREREKWPGKEVSTLYYQTIKNRVEDPG